MAAYKKSAVLVEYTSLLRKYRALFTKHRARLKRKGTYNGAEALNVTDVVALYAARNVAHIQQSSYVLEPIHHH